VFGDNLRVITRKGIKYEIDLSEGVDLSLFLFGNYQKHVSQNKYLSLESDSVIFDVGANFGLMTLQFAKLVPSGKVYAFEPTFYAFSKLEKNIELNPILAKNIVAIQSFVSLESTETPDIKAYSSWKVGGSVEEGKHRIHGGVVKSAKGVKAVSLDDFCEHEQIERLDFIKIDTDGHELEVLKGAKEAISKFEPIIVFEVGMYIINERGIDFQEYLKFFDSLSYSLFNSSNLKEITALDYCRHIPLKGTIDILALPESVTK